MRITVVNYIQHLQNITRPISFGNY